MSIKKTLLSIFLMIVVVAIIADTFDLDKYYLNFLQQDGSALSGNPCSNSPVTKVIMIADSAEGKYLADAQCRTLYFNSADYDGTPTCVDDCIVVWKPLYYDLSLSNLSGDTYDKLNVIKVNHGTDGSYYHQYTYSPYPLFSYRGDNSPGDMKGSGLNNGTWSVFYLEK